MRQIQCDKYNANGMWQVQYFKYNMTNAMWQIQFDKLC